jgi:phosphoenolpyruvate carboxykinase (GTP)
MMDRLRGDIGGVDSPVGTLPKLADLDLSGLDMDVADATEIVSVKSNEIGRDALDAQSLLTLIGDAVPAAIWAENAETLSLSQ